MSASIHTAAPEASQGSTTGPQESSAEFSPRKFRCVISTKWALAAIIALGALLRVYGLDDVSLQWVEGFSVEAAAHPSWSVWINENHPPLYYLVLMLWSQISESDFWLRLLSVAFGVATIPVVYSLGRRLFSENAGLASAAALSVTSFHMLHSQQARMYTLLTLLFACALWGLIVATREGRRIGWYVYVISCAGLAYSHGIGVLYVAVVASLFPLCTGSFRPNADWKPWILCNVAIILLFAPWLGVLLTRAAHVAADWWIPAPNWRAPLQLLTELVARLIPAAVPAWVWKVAIASSVACSAFGARPETRWAVRVMIAAGVLPVVLVFAISHAVAPLFIPRVFLPLSVPLAILIGSSLSVQDRYRSFAVGTCVAALMVMTVSAVYQLRYPEEPEPWRPVSKYLQENVGARDVVIYAESLHEWYAILPIGQALVRRYDMAHVLEKSDQIVLNKVISGCDAQSRAERCLDESIRKYQPGTAFWIVSIDRYYKPDDVISRWVRRHFSEPTTHEFRNILIERVTLLR